MKVLFVSSGNNKGGIGVLVKNQGNSLIEAGIDLTYFTIKGRGIKGYIMNIKTLRKHIRENNYDIVHAHYSLSAFVASFAGGKPLIASLMGSDTYSTFPFNYFIRFFYLISWESTIVKTNRMKEKLHINKSIVVPNGVDIERFKPMPRKVAREKVGFDNNSKYVVFVADPSRNEKNFCLAEKAFNLISDSNIKLFVVSGVSNDSISFYLNGADALILTSKWEGSVNVVKEAMACNCPIISTDVGDVKWVIGDTAGCYISSFKPEEIAEKVKEALIFGQRTNGRDRILKLGLDSKSIAKKIVGIYNSVLIK